MTLNVAGNAQALSVLSALLLLLVSSLSSWQAPTARYFPTRDTWERRTPAQVGMNEARLNAAIEFAMARDVPGRDFAGQRRDPGQLGPLPLSDRAGVNGIVLRNGYIVAEFGDTAHVDPSYSVAKSYLSTLLGLAIDRKLITRITDPVGEYVSDGGYDSPHNARITWEHHARQTSEWEGTLFGKPASASCTTADGTPITLTPHEAGTAFEYNDVRVNRFALSLLRVWKRPLPNVLKTEIMDPIGASDSWSYVAYDNAAVQIDGETMMSVPGGSRWGGGLWMSTRDHARFGLLMLRNGNWNGRQVISETWIRQATVPGGLEGNRSYGYLWWVNQGGLWPDVGRSSFAASGNGPNMIWIDPELDLVVVLRWFGDKENDFLKQVVDAVEPVRVSTPSPRIPFDVPGDWPEVLEAGGAIKLPRRVNQVPFVPPSGTQGRGDPIVQILIAPNGTVRDAKILRGVFPPDMALYEAAIATAKQWVFTPTIVDGVSRPFFAQYVFLMDKVRCAQ